jgi:hypothetical protein
MDQSQANLGTGSAYYQLVPACASNDGYPFGSLDCDLRKLALFQLFYCSLTHRKYSRSHRREKTLLFNFAYG